MADAPSPDAAPALHPDAADVRAWTERLGLPGLFDVHTHFLPPRVIAKVRAQFDSAGPLIGRPWPLRYRDTDERLAAILGELGVRHFSALPYAHKPGMAEYLNDWAADFAVRTPAALHCGTFFPEPGAAEVVRRRIESGLELFKVHVQVGAFHVTDPLLDEAWGVIAEAGVPVVLHAGSGPIPTEHTGPGPVVELLRRHPRLPLVMAHLGAPEYREFLELAEAYEHVRLDTTMAFTDFFDEMGGPFPPDLLPRLQALGDKVLLGSDFPNIPYAYGHQLEALERLGLGEEWLRAVCWRTEPGSSDAMPDPSGRRAMMPGVVAPTFEQLSSLPAFCEQVVPQRYEDINGHLNVRHYVGIASEGLDEALVALGIPQQYPNTHNKAVFTAEHHMAYLNELRTGDQLSVRVRLLGRAERAAHVLVYLVDETNERVAFVMEEIFLHVDLADRKTSPWPAEIAELLDARIEADAKLPFEAQTSGALALR